jgi:hypothetical protein
MTDGFAVDGTDALLDGVPGEADAGPDKDRRRPRSFDALRVRISADPDGQENGGENATHHQEHSEADDESEASDVKGVQLKEARVTRRRPPVRRYRRSTTRADGR